MANEGRPVADLEWRFQYHAPDAEAVKRHEQLRASCYQLAQVIDALCPNGREKSTAISKVEEALLWGNAAIARER